MPFNYQEFIDDVGHAVACYRKEKRVAKAPAVVGGSRESTATAASKIEKIITDQTYSFDKEKAEALFIVIFTYRLAALQDSDPFKNLYNNPTKPELKNDRLWKVMEKHVTDGLGAFDFRIGVELIKLFHQMLEGYKVKVGETKASAEKIYDYFLSSTRAARVVARATPAFMRPAIGFATTDDINRVKYVFKDVSILLDYFYNKAELGQVFIGDSARHSILTLLHALLIYYHKMDKHGDDAVYTSSLARFVISKQWPGQEKKYNFFERLKAAKSIESLQKLALIAKLVDLDYQFPARDWHDYIFDFMSNLEILHDKKAQQNLLRLVQVLQEAGQLDRFFEYIYTKESLNKEDLLTLTNEVVQAKFEIKVPAKESEKEKAGQKHIELPLEVWKYSIIPVIFNKEVELGSKAFKKAEAIISNCCQAPAIKLLLEKAGEMPPNKKSLAYVALMLASGVNFSGNLLSNFFSKYQHLDDVNFFLEQLHRYMNWYTEGPNKFYMNGTSKDLVSYILNVLGSADEKLSETSLRRFAKTAELRYLPHEKREEIAAEFRISCQTASLDEHVRGSLQGELRHSEIADEQMEGYEKKSTTFSFNFRA